MTWHPPIAEDSADPRTEDPSWLRTLKEAAMMIEPLTTRCSTSELPEDPRICEPAEEG